VHFAFSVVVFCLVFSPFFFSLLSPCWMVFLQIFIYLFEKKHTQKMKPFCPMIFNYFQIFGHFATYHQILSHSKTTRCANMTKFMLMTEHKNHITIICKKKIRTQFCIAECLIIAKSKTPIQLCMFYNQQTL